MRFFTFVFLLFCLSLSSRATHIVGGEMFYEYQGNNKYKITIKLYRDCNPNITGQYPNNINLAIYKSNGVLYTQVSVPFPGATILANTANNPCLIVPPNICVQEAVYKIDSVLLPPTAGGYNLVCAFCCRNLTIVNIPSNNNVGATYISSLPASSFGINNEAYFNNFPPTVICANYPFEFDHSATDPDGDSLSYALCVLYDNSNGQTQPTTPGPPPFPQINNYYLPYSFQNPMGGNPALAVDPVTGMLTVTPTATGQFVVGVCVKEYRNGVLMNEHRRDFQFNVTTCTPTVQAIIVPNADPNIPIITNCTDLTLTFPNNSTPNAVYHWDFGLDSTVTDDTSDLWTPTFTYPDTGTYLVTLIVNPVGTQCADTTEGYVVFYPTLVADIDVVPDGCTGNTIQFNDQSVSTYGTVSEWSWNLSDNATSSLQHPTHIYTDTGQYPIQLIVSTDLGCKDTINTSIDINTGSIESVFGDTLICIDDIAPIGVNGAGLATWTPDYNISNTSSLVTTVFPDEDTWYHVTVVSPDGCIEKDSVYVQVWDTLVAVAGPDTIICPGESVTLHGSGGLIYEWSPSTGLTETGSEITVATPDESTVYLFTTRVSGCMDTATVVVNVWPYPTLYLQDSAFICPGDSVQLIPTGGTAYVWSPSDGLSSTNASAPYAFPSQTTTYYLESIDANACPVTLYDTVIITVPDNNHSLSGDTTVILGTSAVLNIYGGSSYSWSPSNGMSDPNASTVIVSPGESTTYTVLITYADGCYETDEVSVGIMLDPYVVFPNAFTPNGDGVNSRFRPFVMGYVDVEAFRIYNRWGKLVYDGKSIEGWDGTYNGVEQGIGTYAYYFIGKGTFSGTAKEYYGNFTLLR